MDNTILIKISIDLNLLEIFKAEFWSHKMRILKINLIMKVVADEKFHLVLKNCWKDQKKVQVLLHKTKIKKQKKQKLKKKIFLSKKKKRNQKENRNLTIRKTLTKNKVAKKMIGRKELTTNSLSPMEVDQNGKIG